MIDRSTIQRIMDTANIIDVVKEFVTLRKAGVNFKGLCPFHNEKTPSFVVSPSKQICKCYGCGKGGNVVHFLMEIEHLTYPEALKWLGRKYGIEVIDKDLTDEQRQRQSLRESMFVLNNWASNFFEKSLHQTPDGVAIALSYFRQRGLRDDMIKKFNLGYSPEDCSVLAQSALSAGFSKDILVKTGLIFETEDHRLFDRYHGRVIYPIHTVSGKVVAFGGRILVDNKNVGKYVNSPESEIYSKSEQLYGLYQARQAITKEGFTYLVEGYMDVIAMHQSGIENVVASSGTALTLEQIRLIHRFTENVVVLFDGDSAGIHASLRSIDLLLSEGLSIKVLPLPTGEDPDSFSKKYSPLQLREELQKRMQDFIQYKSELLLKQAGEDPVKKAQVVGDIVESISVIPSGLLRQSYAHKCAEQLQVDEQLILLEVAKKRKVSSSTTEAKKPSSSAAITIDKETKIEKIEKLLAGEIVLFGEKKLFEENGNSIKVVKYIQQELSTDYLKFSNPIYQRILEEALVAAENEDWSASAYFLSHPDEKISTFAAHLTAGRDDLCKMNKQQYGELEPHLREQIPHLMNDYKIALIEEKINKLKTELNVAYSKGDMDKSIELMKEIKKFTEVSHVISKATSKIVF